MPPHTSPHTVPSLFLSPFTLSSLLSAFYPWTGALSWLEWPERGRRADADRDTAQRSVSRRSVSASACPPSERECCLLVLNLVLQVSSTLPCIRQPGPRLRVLDVRGFVVSMHTGVHMFLAFELLVNNASSGTLAFSVRLVPFLPAADSPATHAGSSASPSLAHPPFPGTSSATLPPYCLL